MKNRTALILLYSISLVLLIGSSFLPSEWRILGTLLYLFPPFTIGVGIFTKKNGTKVTMYQGEREKGLPYLFFAPILLGIILISFVTNLALSSLGLVNPPVEKVPIIEALVLYAVLPAVLEEAFFRILPALALNDEDTWSVCIFSTLVFGFAHMSVFSIPYALFAGLSFFLVNRLARSPLPSILLHLGNNLLSLWFLYTNHQDFVHIVVLCALFLLSLFSFIIAAKFYTEPMLNMIQAFRKKKEPFRFTLDLLIYLAFTLTMTILLI